MSEAKQPVAIETARKALQDALAKAATTLVECLDSEDLRVKLRAAEAILNRAGITEAEVNSSTAAEIEVGGAEDPYRTSKDVAESDLYLPCPKCGGSVAPDSTEGTCPHCGSELRLTLLLAVEEKIS